MVLLIMLYKKVLTIETVEEILKCNHSNGCYRAIFFCGAVYCFCSRRLKIPSLADETLKFDHSNESD